MQNNNNGAIKWSKKYGFKPFKSLTNGTIVWYNWCSKISRKDFIKRSRKKTKVFIKHNPNNLLFRVFKATVLNNKNVTPELLIEFKKLINKTGTTRNAYRYKHLTPKEILRKMKGLI